MKCDVFLFFSEVLEESLDVCKFLRRLKEGHKRFLDFKNLKILKNWIRRRTQDECKFTKDSSIHAML